jgi:hypothetical protein
MKKLFYSTLFFLFLASLAGLAITTAVLPTEPVESIPVRSLAPPVPVIPAG